MSSYLLLPDGEYVAFASRAGVCNLFVCFDDEQIRRQSTWELRTFKERWNRAVEEDKNWIDRSSSTRNRISNNRRFKRSSVISSLLQSQAEETRK